MSKYSIEIKATNNESIRKFEANSFLIRGEGYEFTNIDEASKSPIAQELFYLPFVKTIYISQNFVAIEKFNIVKWEEVEEEVAAQITTFLNSGKEVVKAEAESKKTIPVTVYAESTPNPKVMKFVANKKLVINTTEFKNIDEAKNAPLAQKLFHFPFVKEVFFDENYISITKFDIAEWEEITMEIREFIRNYIQEGNVIITEESATPTSTKSEENATSSEFDNLDDISKQIVAILDEYIKPAVASDGGNIMFNSYDPETKKVSVILQGACSGCPSSTFTLKSGIETMLKDMLHGKVESVEAING
ncbi:NifU family protein [Mesonia aestuariivivens]|uniref:NifU family protein n=1 Tax=Mesonia aestuariivivens TaxID=2796128 RepID=A0ABS6W3H6_9FLAO|nr:NifU family protein [Mesonia aestuariivivens]MBW2962422.1 NifU family protein [Mesonia aestuariivivens]